LATASVANVFGLGMSLQDLP